MAEVLQDREEELDNHRHTGKGQLDAHDLSTGFECQPEYIEQPDGTRPVD